MPSIMMRHSIQGPSFVRFSVLAGVSFNEISAKEVVKLSFFRTFFIFQNIFIQPHGMTV